MAAVGRPHSHPGTTRWKRLAPSDWGIYLNVGSLQRGNINPIYVNETLNSIQYI